jgi:hypothetical protein
MEKAAAEVARVAMRASFILSSLMLREVLCKICEDEMILICVEYSR